MLTWQRTNGSFPSLNVTVRFCDFFSHGFKINNNYIKDNNALQKQTKEKGRSLQFWCYWFIFCRRVSAGEFNVKFLRMTILFVILSHSPLDSKTLQYLREKKIIKKKAIVVVSYSSLKVSCMVWKKIIYPQ